MDLDPHFDALADSAMVESDGSGADRSYGSTFMQAAGDVATWYKSISTSRRSIPSG
jgi:hypothetical protein